LADSERGFSLRTTRPADRDLQERLIDDHKKALCAALQPWSRGGAVDENLLRVAEVASLNELATARVEFNPIYVHLLAHGALTAQAGAGRPKRNWGLRLGFYGEDGVARTKPSSLTQTTVLRRSCTGSAFPSSSRPSFH
jgi:hypothetical protein